MTMLMHTRGPPERAPQPSERREATGTGAARVHLATIKRCLIRMLAVLAGVGALAAITAIKVIVYLPRLHH